MNFYRVGQDKQGGSLWYSKNGQKTDLWLNNEFSFLDRQKVPQMPFDEQCAGWLSACLLMSELRDWWQIEHVDKLKILGFKIFEYETDTFKVNHEFKHFLIPIDSDFVTEYDLTELLKT